MAAKKTKSSGSTKKTKSSGSTNSANALAKELQKIASDAQVQVQKLANEATEKSFKYNTEEANTARTWQEKMSNTSHQREVADLKKAGLNPVLSANSGAQSYTTSSASAQANDASGASASLLGAEMSGMAQGYSADQSAKATRYAARQSAAAMKASANAQAAAARYAAGLQYQASVYHSNKAYELGKYQAKMQYKTAIDKPASNWSGLIDKYATRSGISNTIVSGIKTTVKAMQKKPQLYFTNKGEVNKNNFKLSDIGKAYVSSNVARAGLKANNSNRNLFVKAFVFGDKSAFATYTALTKTVNAAKKTNRIFYSPKTNSLNRYYYHH